MSENTNILEKTQEKVNENVEANKPAELDVEPREFPIHTQGYITNTDEVVKLVSSLFGIFKDYAGCNVYAYMGQSAKTSDPAVLNTVAFGSFYVDLYFKKDNNSAAIGMDNLILTSDTKGGSALSRLSALSGNNMHKVYMLNDDTKSILLKYLSGYQPVGFNPMWEKRIVEVPDVQAAPTYTYMMNNNTNVPVILRVEKLSLDAIIAEIYGRYADSEEKDADKNKKNPHYDYHCIPLTTSVAGISPMLYGVMQQMTAEERVNSQKWVIQILRNDRAIIEATQKAIGYNPVGQVNGYVPYIR